MMHGSRVCLGLASLGQKIAETCFTQMTPSLEFHASGLAAGTSYLLRAVVMERGAVLAVCVRSFRVGGVSIGGLGLPQRQLANASPHSMLQSVQCHPAGLRSTLRNRQLANAQAGGGNVSPAVTFQTALQVAVARHVAGEQGRSEAEGIYRQIIGQKLPSAPMCPHVGVYRQIIGQDPAHAGALHLLDQAKLQRGDASHDPTHAGALHLLGQAQMQRGDAAAALPLLRRALAGEWGDDEGGGGGGAAAARANLHNTLGECLRLAGRVHEAIGQFKEGLALNGDLPLAKFNLALAHQDLGQWDAATAVYTSLLDAPAPFGNSAAGERVLLEAATRRCDLLAARGGTSGSSGGGGAAAGGSECWRAAARRWPRAAHAWNELGNALLREGDVEEAAEAFDAARDRGMALAALNSAVVLELGGNEDESARRYQEVLRALRAEQYQEVLRALTAEEVLRALRTERAQGLPDRHVLIKLVTLPPRAMPPTGLPDRHVLIKLGTLSPRAMPPTAAELARHRQRLEKRMDDLLALPWGDARYQDNSQPLSHGFSLGRQWAYHGVSNRALKSKLHRVYSLFCPALMTGDFVREGGFGGAALSAAAPPVRSVAAAHDGSAHHQQHNNAPQQAQATRRLRVGFVSRYLYSHAVGVLSEGIITHLPRDRYEVFVFSITPFEGDPLHKRVAAAAEHFTALRADLLSAAASITAAALDVLVYPETALDVVVELEIGLDPVSYFLSFQRLAPVQVAWWGHPDTTGVPTIDWFLSSLSADVPGARGDAMYTERLYRVATGLGAYVTRPARSLDISAAAMRANMQQQLGLPVGFHLYLVPQALAKFHPSFDAVLLDILNKDRLARLLLLNGGESRALSRRLDTATGEGEDAHASRLLFYEVVGEQEMLALYEAADVVLDALSVGTPVVTLPGPTLGGRFTYAMYERMGVMDAVVKTAQRMGAMDAAVVKTPQLKPAPTLYGLQGTLIMEYVNTALHLAHNTDARAALRTRIRGASACLFEDAEAIAEWDRFLSHITSATGAGAAAATGAAVVAS
ncbi:hypothetical protein JKP88DRAFT_286990 [Tribonema minus]|uniref:protein O-GlcNAc transferase n=1 Tax=Tribonema minus TaxID=303371 RepID=A0A835Z795_9STRA|nr:hypothetical protein JKP88DRAFT_286990 [Tribonema minus]